MFNFRITFVVSTIAEPLIYRCKRPECTTKPFLLFVSSWCLHHRDRNLLMSLLNWNWTSSAIWIRERNRVNGATCRLDWFWIWCTRLVAQLKWCLESFYQSAIKVFYSGLHHADRDINCASWKRNSSQNIINSHFSFASGGNWWITRCQ